eukprot:CAMPEP_0115017978 /NCGR_PEP_ID=MMETSP0216-20121206/28485_1 /TAXON_ID=223996 /ORGANISM="Protocruzia adherens, Strain Boccale" /LENGTH=586 /DNA_ID=CAMNT_0002388991 /DNA_START=16 /DNA_END=1776 /DNA_ORIENTATION=+
MTDGRPSYEALLEENQELHKALSYMENSLREARNESEAIKKVHGELKIHHEKVQKECAAYNQKAIEAIQGKKDLELQFNEQMKSFKLQFDQGQRELDEMQAKLVQPADYNMMRIGIMNELEGPHKQELQMKQNEVDKLSEQLYETRRKFEILKTEADSYKYDNEKMVHDLKERQRVEVGELMDEISTLNERIEDSKDKERIRLLKKEADEGRIRNEKLLEEIEDLRKERDALRNQKHQDLLNFSREVDQEKSAKRALGSEVDRLGSRVQSLEDDIHGEIMKNEQKTQEITSLIQERDHGNTMARQWEEKYKTVQREQNDLKDRLAKKDMEYEDAIKKIHMEEREKYIIERKEKGRLQREIEGLEKNFQHADGELKNSHHLHNLELEKVQKECRVLEEEKKILAQQNSSFKEEVDNMKAFLEMKHNDNEQLEREYNNLRDKFREITEKTGELERVKTHLEASLKIAQGGEGPDGFRRKVEALEAELQEAKRSGGDSKKMIELKKKTSTYKSKVRQANENIRTLTQTVRKLDHEKRILARRLAEMGDVAGVDLGDDGHYGGADSQTSQWINDVVGDPERLRAEIAKPK